MNYANTRFVETNMAKRLIRSSHRNGGHEFRISLKDLSTKKGNQYL